MANAAVVGGDPRRAQQLCAARVRAIAKPEQCGRITELILEDRERRDSHASADKQRPASLSGGRESIAKGPDEAQLIARAEFAQPVRAGPDGLDQKLQLDAVLGGSRTQHAERQRQERALAIPTTPPGRR